MISSGSYTYLTFFYALGGGLYLGIVDTGRNCREFLLPQPVKTFCKSRLSRYGYSCIMNRIPCSLRAIVLIVLLLGVAQPRPNFFACVVRSPELDRSRSGVDGCIRKENVRESQSSRDRQPIVRKKPYLPCCESVSPLFSLSEFRQFRMPAVAHPVLHLLPGDCFSNHADQTLFHATSPQARDGNDDIPGLILRC